MTQPAKVQEPSMEEILASIRRIIADDEAKPPAAEKAAAPPAAPPKAEKPAPAPKPVASEAPLPKPPAAPPKAILGLWSQSGSSFDALAPSKVTVSLQRGDKITKCTVSAPRPP